MVCGSGKTKNSDVINDVFSGTARTDPCGKQRFNLQVLRDSTEKSHGVPNNNNNNNNITWDDVEVTQSKSYEQIFR